MRVKKAAFKKLIYSFAGLNLPFLRKTSITVESRLYVQVGTQKFGRRTDCERDVQVKIISRITPCKVFWIRLHQWDVQTSGTYN